MAPVTPFIVEHMFQNLKRIAPKAQRVDSVHYLMMPQPIEVGQSALYPEMSTEKTDQAKSNTRSSVCSC